MTEHVGANKKGFLTYLHDTVDFLATRRRWRGLEESSLAPAIS